MYHHKLIIFLVLALSGCASTSFEELGRQLDTAINGDQVSPDQVEQSDDYSLTIRATPIDSTIKIMNIKPKYHDGIRLEPGAYDILVKRDGHESYRKWIKISNSDITRNVVLNKLTEQISSSSSSSSSPTTTQESTQSSQLAEPSVVLTNETAVNKSKNDQREIQKIKPDSKKLVSKKIAREDPRSSVQTSNDEKSSEGSTLAADYLPPELDIASELESAEITEDEQPKFNGVYLKSVKEGVFLDTVKLVELTQKPAYVSRLFRLRKGGRTSITGVLKKPKRYFALDIEGTITMPAEQFNGVIIKGKDHELISLHRVDRWVRGYDEEGGKTGDIATMFDSNKHVDIGDDIYIPKENVPAKKSKLGNDSHFITFKGSPEKGLYIAWAGYHFWFFNLI